MSKDRIIESKCAHVGSHQVVYDCQQCYRCAEERRAAQEQYQRDQVTIQLLRSDKRMLEEQLARQPSVPPGCADWHSEAIDVAVRERDAWIREARIARSAADKYREDLESIGRLHPKCFVADDGHVHPEVLITKVVKVVTDWHIDVMRFLNAYDDTRAVFDEIRGKRW